MAFARDSVKHALVIKFVQECDNTQTSDLSHNARRTRVSFVCVYRLFSFAVCSHQVCANTQALIDELHKAMQVTGDGSSQDNVHVSSCPGLPELALLPLEQV